MAKTKTPASKTASEPKPLGTSKAEKAASNTGTITLVNEEGDERTLPQAVYNNLPAGEKAKWTTKAPSEVKAEGEAE